MQDPTFGPYTQPHYAPGPVFFTDLPNGVEDSGFAYTPGPEIPQAVLADHRASNSDARLHHAPEVTSYTKEGYHGTPVVVFLQTLHDLFAPPTISFSVSFGDCRVPASLQLVGDLTGPLRQYGVSCEAPPFPATGCFSLSDVPLQLVMSSADKSSAAFGVSVGTFTYNEAREISTGSRKRKASSDETDFDVQPPRKRVFNAQIHIQDRNTDPSEYDQTSPYSTLVPTPTGSGVYQALPRTTSPKSMGHHYSTSTASQVSLTAPSPHTPSYSPSFATVKTEQSPCAPMTPGARPASASSQHKSSVPKLVRTSTIQQSPPQLSSGDVTNIRTQSFNPYTIYPLKATLKLCGDLDAVQLDWTDEQRDARRKLVEFTRSQNGSTITANFAVVSPEERQQHNITISCIWWKEKNECFVTSVDTIYLLEALVGVRFTVEEKNRIRRNLEGFRPLTVSKAKADSEEFFKVIMGFPHPKPRNIEKDVKVFPWKVLSQALKKIIGKYSASYSSTASAMVAPAPNMYPGNDSSSEYLGYQVHSDVVTTSMPSYPVVSTTSFSPHMTPGRVSAPVPTASMPDLRLQVPLTGHGYPLSANLGFHPITAPPHSAILTPHIMSAPPAARMPQSWEYAPFVNDSLATVVPHSASAVYSRSGIETAEFGTPVTYSMEQK